MRKTIKNTLLLFTSRFGSRFLVFIFSIYLARVLGSSDFGKFLFASSFILTFVSLADFGIENYLLREVSRRYEERVSILRSLFYPRLILAIIVYFLSLIAGILAGYNQEDLFSIALYGLVLVPYSINYFFIAYFNAQEKFIKSSLLKICYPLINVVLGLIFLQLHFNYRWILLAGVIANTASALILFIFYQQTLKGIRISFWQLKEICQKTWPFAVLIFMAVVYLRADVLLLKRMVGSTATGLFGPASTLVETAILIPQSFALAIYPISSRLVKDDKKKMKQVYLMGLKTLFIVSIPLAGLGYWLTPFFVPILFGGGYLASIPALQVAFLSLVLFFINALPGNVILNSQKVRGFIPWALSNLLIGILLNLVLIPPYSYVGSAWAKVGSEFYGLLINNFYVYKILNE